MFNERGQSISFSRLTRNSDLLFAAPTSPPPPGPHVTFDVKKMFCIFSLVMFYTKYEDHDQKSKSQSGGGNMKGLSKLFQTQFDNTEWE